jgi:hypothetical protein
MANIINSNMATTLNNNISIYNMVFATVLGVIITSSVQVIPMLVMKFIYFMRPYFVNLYKKIFGQYNEVILTSLVQNSGNTITESSPIEYDAIVFKINKKNINTICVQNKERSQKNNQYRIDLNDSHSNDDELSSGYKICHSDIFKISSKHDIYVKCSINKDDDNYSNNNKYNCKVTTYNMCVLSKKLSVPELISKIEEWRIKYINHKKCYIDDGNIYYYYFDETKSNQNSKQKKPQNMFSLDHAGSQLKSQSDIISWNKYQLKTTKSFKNIFFDDKDKLLKRLDYFMNNKAEYSRKGIPYNLGLLFYGEPGCGKTSCIKALSNYTKRNVIEINLKNIKTCGEFINVFRNEFINDQYIPIDKRIIVLEDIDCMIDVVKQRESITFNDDSVSNHMNEQINSDEIMNVDTMLKVALIDSYKMNNTNNTDNLTLSCILNTIDGILEQDGRIIIITTNYKDKLDTALLRPGRIDMKLQFTKCSNVMTKNIVEHFYNEKISDTILLANNLHTPAEIIEKCFNNADSINKVLEILS